MQKQITLGLFTILTALALGGCGIAGSGSDGNTFKIGNISYLNDLDGSLTIGPSTVKGSGTIIASNAVAASTTASVGFKLEGTLSEEPGALIELIAFANKDGRNLVGGTRIQISRNDIGVPFVRIFDSVGEVSMIPQAQPLLNNKVDFVIDIHEGGSEVFVWPGDVADAEETNTLVNTNELHAHEPVRSTGLSWGVRLNKATLQSATTLTTPHLKHNH